MWLSKKGKFEYPDRLIFDLDPPQGNFQLVREAALALKETCDAFQFAAFIMTTGSKGMHVVVPLDASADFETVHLFAKRMADALARKHPGLFTTHVQKEQRASKLFLDYLRNSYAQTSVAPYAVRALARAPVATPLSWDEVDDPNLGPQSYTIRNIFQRLARQEDPWHALSTHQAKIGPWREDTTLPESSARL